MPGCCAVVVKFADDDGFESPAPAHIVSRWRTTWRRGDGTWPAIMMARSAMIHSAQFLKGWRYGYGQAGVRFKVPCHPPLISLPASFHVLAFQVFPKGWRRKVSWGTFLPVQKIFQHSFIWVWVIRCLFRLFFEADKKYAFIQMFPYVDCELPTCRKHQKLFCWMPTPSFTGHISAFTKTRASIQRKEHLRAFGFLTHCWKCCKSKSPRI